MNLSKKRVVGFTGGGTGGHIFPIIALIDYAQQHKDIVDNCKFYRFGGYQSMEQYQASTLTGVDFVPVASGKMRRYRDIEAVFRNIVDFFFVIIGFFQSLWLLKKCRIEVLFCKGGFVALPVSIAARVLRIPVLVHESDMHVGLANRIVSKVATGLYSGFSGIFTNETVVGQILSGKLLTPKRVELEGYTATKTTILIMGGSQGSERLMGSLETLLYKFPDYQFITILGAKNNHRHEKLSIPGHSRTVDFLTSSELGYIYGLSDIAITRGSATSLAEQDIHGIKKIIVPLPYTGGNHQEINADRYVTNKGDHKLLQNDNLLDGLHETLVQYKGFKKPSIEPNHTNFYAAHATVWEGLLGEKSF